MKILEIIPQLSSGGGERFVVDLCNELSKEHDVTLMVLHSLDKVDFYLKAVDQSGTFFFYQVGNFVIIVAFVFST